jgi:membrane fusion protein (multidrug efflux system)
MAKRKNIENQPTDPSQNKFINFLQAIRKRLTTRWLIVIGIIILAIVAWRVIAARRSRSELETTTVKRGDVAEELILSGEISADEYAQLAFQTSGEIAWIGVKEGDWVKKGQPLARLDTANLNSELQRAYSDLRSAEAALDEVYDEVKNHDSDETFEQKATRTAAEVAKDKAYEAVLKAQENLRNAALRAPFEGLVSYVANPFSGVNVTLGTTQIQVVNPETIHFIVSADQSEVIDLHQDQEVRLVLDSYPDKEFIGKVNYISFTPKSDEVGAVYEVKVIFPSDDADLSKLRIGMTGDAKFILSEKSDVLYVPPEFVNSDTKGKYVNLGKTNNKVYIETGIEGEERVEIMGDIKEGDTLYD